MIFQILVTLFLAIMFFMLFSSRHAYFMRVPILLTILFGMVCVWRLDVAAAAARFLGVGRTNDLIFSCSILLAFYCFFILYLKHEKTREDITELARRIAIDGALSPADAKDD